MSAYKNAITDAMTALGKEQDVVFVGYTLKYGTRMGGTLANVPDDKIEEMPVAENLMVGVATSLSLAGWVPVIVFDRFDFLLLALDAIVNQLDKLGRMSGGLHKPACIIRVIVGNSHVPLFSCETHIQDYTKALAIMLPSIRVSRAGIYPPGGFLVSDLSTATDRERIGDKAAASIGRDYGFALADARRYRRSSILVEYKDLWE